MGLCQLNDIAPLLFSILNFQFSIFNFLFPANLSRAEAAMLLAVIENGELPGCHTLQRPLRLHL